MPQHRLPPWPADPPEAGNVQLRAVTESDIGMARQLAADPYVPHIGSLPANATEDELLQWLRRQQQRYTDGDGFSFTIEDTTTGHAVGHCGLWLTELASGRGTAGYSIVQSARGRGLAAEALTALTEFGWTVPGLMRISLYIEPWNQASIRTAEKAGYTHGGLHRSHQEIAGERRDMLLYSALREG